MDTSVAEELLDEVLPWLEALEAQNAAIAQFLREKGIATDEQLAPYVEQAKNASSVRWRAARLRIERLLSTAIKATEQAKEKVPDKAAEKPPEKTKDAGAETAQGSEASQDSDRSEKTGKHQVNDNKGKEVAAGRDSDDEKKRASGEQRKEAA